MTIRGHKSTLVQNLFVGSASRCWSALKGGSSERVLDSFRCAVSCEKVPAHYGSSAKAVLVVIEHSSSENCRHLRSAFTGEQTEAAHQF